MSAYERLRSYLRESAHLESVGNLLGWDQETYMPEGGAGARAEQSALMARLLHERQSAPELGELISAAGDEVGGEGETVRSANVREARRDYAKRTRVPAALVARLAEAKSRAQHCWKSARERSDFSAFRPMLDAVLDLTRERARCLSDGGELYDALLDEYEPGMRGSEIEAIFAPLRAELSGLIREITELGTPPATGVLSLPVPSARQEAFGRFVAGACGFDFGRGRLDVTAHPFCETVAPGDVRLTTRYREDAWTESLFGTMHEAGHGLYEQGLDPAEAGMPAGQAVSLGMHESQSRLWENAVGLSVAFWRFAFPHAQRLLGGALSGETPESIASALNTATPGLNRVESDEGTYNLHIMIRFELERAMIRGDLSTHDLPAAWNDRYRELLGLDVPGDREGCLQDVHWSLGLIGYFPTYTLGNLHMAQLWAAIRRDLSGLEGLIERGEFSPLLAWLRENIHRHGRRYPAAELTRRATGKALSAAPFMDYLRARLRPNYGLA